MMRAARTAQAEDLASITQALADAFGHDPIMSWARRGEVGDRRDWLVGMFGYLAEHRYLPLGQSVVIEGGGALWLPRGADDSEDDFWTVHGELFMGAIGGPNARLIELSQAMDEHHPPEPHRYLLAIGVETGRQGRGLGGEMMGFATAELDATGEDAYLEATSAQSRALYERHGFETLGEFSAADSPLLWPMWREAQPRR